MAGSGKSVFLATVFGLVVYLAAVVILAWLGNVVASSVLAAGLGAFMLRAGGMFGTKKKKKKKKRAAD